MSNSYSVNEIPTGVLYGEYDSINGEWTGHWFLDRESAQTYANGLDPDGPQGVVSTSNDEWLEPA